MEGRIHYSLPDLFCTHGIALLWIEWSMERFGGKFGHPSTPFILDTMDRRKFYKYISVFGILTNIAIAANYCYLESWTMAYVYQFIAGTFQNMNQHEVASFFINYVDIGTSTTGLPYESIIFFLLCVILNT